MAIGQQHIIQQQFFEVQSNKQSGSFELQTRISRNYWDKIVPALERLFDDYVSADEVLQIERLDLDLGTLNPDNLEAELSQAILTALREQLDKLVLNSSNLEVGVKRAPLRENRLAQWLYFLETGTLAWNMPSLPESEWQRDILEILATEQSAIQQVQAKVQQTPQLLERLVLQYKTSFLSRLVEVFTGKSQQQLSPYQVVLTKLIQQSSFASIRAVLPAAIRSDLQTSFWAFILQKTIVERQKLATDALVTNFIKSNFQTLFQQTEYQKTLRTTLQLAIWTKQEQALLYAIFNAKNLPELFVSEQSESTTSSAREKQAETKQNSTNPPEKIVDAAKETKEQEQASPSEEKNNFSAKEKENTGDEKAASENETLVTTAQKSAESTNIIETTTTAHTAKNISAIEEIKLPQPTSEGLAFFKESPSGTSYYVANAGVILLHPFLGHYFKGIGLVENNQFKDKDAQSLAARLMHYIATKVEDAAEHELLLAKFLCGIPFKQPIPRYEVLPEAAKTEADNMLQAALNHWGALPNTSPDGLRDGFLQREGKLEKRGDVWHLLVEQKTLDILLGKLPWNLSIVKMPWLKELLHVEWHH